MPKIFLDLCGRKTIAAALTTAWFTLTTFSISASGQPDATPPLSADESMLFTEIPSVFGASKYEQQLEEAPSSVTIITAEEIRRYGYRTLADILRSVRGFYVSYDRNYSYIGIRGFSRSTDYNSRVLLLIDGHPTNDNIYGMSAFGTESIIDADDVNHLEIIRGPSSSLYGTNALFGVVNVVTQRGRDIAGTRFGANGSSRGNVAGRLSYGQRFEGGTEVLATVSGFYNSGQERLYYSEYDAPDTNNGIVEHSDQDRARRALLRYSISDFSFEAAYVKREKAVPTAPWVTADLLSRDQRFNNSAIGTRDERLFLMAAYDHEISGRGRVSARLSHDVYFYHGTYPSAYIAGGIINEDSTRGNWWKGEVQYSSSVKDQHRWVFGSAVQYNQHADQKNWEVDPYLSIVDDARNFMQWSLFAQDEWRFSPRWIANLGVRYDHYPVWGGTTNPRLALIYQATPATALKLIYGQAFRAPSLYEIYYYLPNSTWLEPETIRTTEFVVEHALHNGLRAVVSLYQYRMEKLINWQKDWTFKNEGTARAQGIELELEGNLTTWMEGRVSYAWQRAVDEDTDAVLDNSPRQLAKLVVSAPLLGPTLIAGIDAQYTGSRKTTKGGEVDAYAIGNFTLSGRLPAIAVEWSASVYNLTGRSFADPGGEEHLQDSIPQDGRSYRVKVQYEF